MNKQIVIKFRFIEFFQIIIVKITNRLLKISDFYLRDYNTRDKYLYRYSKDIFEYYIKYNLKIQLFIYDLDSISQEIVKTVFRRIQYYYTHSLIKKNDLFLKEELQKSKEIEKEIINYKKDFILSKEIYDFAVFYYKCGLTFLPQSIIEKIREKDFIDGGAYIGDSVIIFEKEFQPKKIYAFEPEKKNYDLLLKTIQLNNLKRVFAIKKGLGEKNEFLRISSEGVLSSISKNGDQSIETINIDDFVNENKLNVGLIKLDVEGFELKVLNGAKETIQKFRPILIISIYHNGEQFFRTKEFVLKLCPNYKLLIRKIHPTTLFTETILIAWIQ